MNRNKFALIFLASLFCITSAIAQKVTTEKQSQKVNGDEAQGFAALLEGKKDDVAISWSKFLKEFGKPKGMDLISISEPALGGTVYSKGTIYADIKDKGDNTWVWLGVIENEWVVNDMDIVKKDLEKEVYRFGIKYYKDKIQEQIDEAQRAHDATTRQSQRLVNQNKDLNIQLGNNEQEKIKLEERLQSNALEHAVLLQKIENNKLAQDSVKAATEQIKKVIELHKERQRKVN